MVFTTGEKVGITISVILIVSATIALLVVLFKKPKTVTGSTGTGSGDGGDSNNDGSSDPDKGLECKNSSDCDSQPCVNGKCVPCQNDPTKTDYVCPQGQNCNLTTGKCELPVPKPPVNLEVVGWVQG